MSRPAIHFSTPRPGIALLEIDAPPANALGLAARKPFFAHLERIESDLSLRAAVITGRGTIFCGGDDLKEREAVARGGGEDASASFAGLVDRIEALRLPVIAAVNGPAVGGGVELTLACDIRVASQEARFVCAAVNVGLIASAYRLPRLIGVARAKHMLMTGLPVDAATAEQYGLVTAVTPPDELLEAALALAERIAGRAPLSVEAAKRVAGAALDLDRQAAARVLSAEFAALLASEDHAEALAAFREKRTPAFRRR